jgi:hypothetical protein
MILKQARNWARIARAEGVGKIMLVHLRAGAGGDIP